mmetsp:Transcript_31323/g.94100  ORF Transcript_31323/g.94100 Transcript_31323/m.94100 type:complete len:880 (+) Transcript_31323:135-2774(+)
MSAGPLPPTGSIVPEHWNHGPAAVKVVKAAPALAHDRDGALRRLSRGAAAAAVPGTYSPPLIDMESPELDSGLPPEVTLFSRDIDLDLGAAAVLSHAEEYDEGHESSRAETPLPDIADDDMTSSDDDELPPLPSSMAPALTPADVAGSTPGGAPRKPRAEVLTRALTRGIAFATSVLVRAKPTKSSAGADSPLTPPEENNASFQPLAQFLPAHSVPLGLPGAASMEDDPATDTEGEEHDGDRDGCPPVPPGTVAWDGVAVIADDEGEVSSNSSVDVDECFDDDVDIDAAIANHVPTSSDSESGSDSAAVDPDEEVAAAAAPGPADGPLTSVQVATASALPTFDPPLKFRTNYAAVKKVLLAAGWQEWSSTTDRERDFNLWWKVGEFRQYEIDELDAWQRVNHFPNETHAICKKDKLARILRKMQSNHGRLFGFLPQSYILPKDHRVFEEAHAAETRDDAAWICKPSGGAQGRGIYVFKDIADLEYTTSCVVQRYIERPLLVDGYKFDLRVYVAVTNYHPLTVYVYREGLARFSTQKYDMSDLTNQYAHLTNTSINKVSPTIEDERGFVGAGCKRTFSDLRRYLKHIGIDDRLAWQRTVSLCVLTLLSIVPEVPQTGTRCMELMGFDVLLDEKLRPWLLEVNYAPSLTQDVKEDALVKAPLLLDTMALCAYRPYDGLRGQARVTQDGRSRPRSTIPSRRRAKAAAAPPSKDGGDKAPEGPTASSEADHTGRMPPVIKMSNASKLRLNVVQDKKAAAERRVAALKAARDRSKRKLPTTESPQTTVRREQALLLRRRSCSDVSDRFRAMDTRVGNYQLVFPFNDATLDASSKLRKRYDAREVISEIRAQQSRFRARLKPAQNGGEEVLDGAEVVDELFLPDV